MAPTDPRREYDDLRVTQDHEVLPPDEFADSAASEPATVGWCAFVTAFDAAGRVLLIQQPWADGWLEPGGAQQPGESLETTAVREVREETGVNVTPVRPHVVHDYTFEHAETGETSGWTSVFYEAHTKTPDVARDPGVDDEEITDVQWFDDLPDDLFNPEHTERIYQRARETV